MVLHLRLESPDYWKDAKCAKIPLSPEYDPYFPLEEDETRENDDYPQEAMVFCNGDADGVVCPIRHQCLLFALANNEKYGVWGGLSEAGRRVIRRKYPPSRSEPVRKEWKWDRESELLKESSRRKMTEDDV